MAYNQQLRYRDAPRPSYRQRPPEDASQPYSPTQYNNAVGAQSFNVTESPQSEPTQRFPDHRYGPQSGNLRQHGGKGQHGPEGRGYYAGRTYDGHEGRNDGRRQNISPGQDDTRARTGDMRRPHEAQRAMDSERRAYVDPGARGPTPPNHAVSPIYTVAPRNDQIQYQDQYQQPPKMGQNHDLPAEPVFDSEPAKSSGSNYNKEKPYHESQNYRAFTPAKSYLSNHGANSANPNERVIIDNQHQGYRKPYTQGTSPGDSGHTAQARFVHDRPYSRSNESQNAQSHSSC